MTRSLRATTGLALVMLGGLLWPTVAAADSFEFSTLNPVVGSYYSFTASIDAPPPGVASYEIRIYRNDTEQVAYCYGRTTCTNSEYAGWWNPDNFNPAPRDYTAKLIAGSTTTVIGKARVDIHPYRYPVDLAISERQTNNGAVTYAATASTPGTIGAPA